MRKQYDFSGGRRGPVVTATRDKTRITIRLDDDLIDWFRQQVEEAGGGNYQTMINEALRAYVESKQEPIETTIRRVVKEELQKTKVGKNRRTKAA
jgi:metal-responsive CopG/Arc/MetJ family transcriptional regulator